MEVLSVVKPLGDNLEYVSDYVDVSQFKRVRMSSYSDTIVQLVLEWTYDLECTYEPLKVSCRTPSTMWRSEVYDAPMSFVRVRVVNQSGKKNCELKVLIRGSGIISLPPKKAEVELPPPTPIAVVERASKSPFHFRNKRLGSKTVAVGSSVSTRDYRLPEYVTRAAILIGGKNGKVELLPFGNPGEILQMTDEGPAWSLIYPPLLLSEESKNKLNPSQQK